MADVLFHLRRGTMSSSYNELTGVWLLSFPEQHKIPTLYNNTLSAVRRQMKPCFMNSKYNNSMWVFPSENDTDSNDLFFK